MKPSIILMGSKLGAGVALQILIDRGWSVKAVVFSKKQGYDWYEGPTLRAVAERNGIPVLSRQQELSQTERVDFVVSYMFRYRVRPEVCSLATRAAVNFHPGPLPGFGGWAFYNVAILEDSPFYGCTCHYMDEGFDTGALFKVRTFPITAAEETATSLERKTQKEMIRLFVDFCQIAEKAKTLPCEEQDPVKVRYLQKEEFDALKEIPVGSDEVTIQKYARAFWFPPYDCAYIKMGGVKAEIVPAMVKGDLASMIHNCDLQDLQNAAKEQSAAE